LTAQCRFENFDEYTRRQYNAKAPHLTNPFGYEETPLRFLDFDVFTKLTVLHQLSVWTFWNPDRIREKMPEKKDSEQLEWVSCTFAFPPF
jgi:DNA-directed RNA polymerase